MPPPALTRTLTPYWTGHPDYDYFRLVATAPKNSGVNPPGPAVPPSFEEALKRLESIVEAMESEELPLETLMSRYEEGTRLARACQEKLAAAEVRIEKLEKDAAGELKLKPLPGGDVKDED